MTIDIYLRLLDPNPWQTRPIDEAHAQALAADIKANTLLQPPVARKFGDRYQLALGHHRLAAFKILDRSTMPVEVRDLTDLEMADIAIAENQKRKDLSPIEKAQALRRLIDEFKLSQEAAGKRFDLTQAAVSHLLRLLKLPAGIQALTDGQRLPERHARQLVTLSKSLPAQAEAVAKKVAEAAPEEKDDTFDSAVRHVLTTHGRQMYNPPFKTEEALPIEHVAEPAGKMGFTELPKCKGCEFFLERYRMNYCARPGCFDIKTQAARWKAAAGSARTLGITLAQPGEKTNLIFDGDDNQVALAKAALKAKHESLRVVVSAHAANDTWRPEARERKELLGSQWLALASTDVAALKKSLPVYAVKQAAKPAPKSLQEREAAQQAKWKAAQAQRVAENKAFDRMIDSVAVLVAPKLPSDEHVLSLIANAVGLRNPGKAIKQVDVAHDLLEEWCKFATRWDLKPDTTASVLTELAAKLKVKLPADFAPGSNGNGHANGKAPKPVKESGVSTGKLSKRAKAKAAKPVTKKGKRK